MEPGPCHQEAADSYRAAGACGDGCPGAHGPNLRLATRAGSSMREPRHFSCCFLRLQELHHPRATQHRRESPHINDTYRITPGFYPSAMGLRSRLGSLHRVAHFPSKCPPDEAGSLYTWRPHAGNRPRPDFLSGTGRDVALPHLIQGYGEKHSRLAEPFHGQR
jgi:hypothetical protein